MAKALADDEHMKYFETSSKTDINVSEVFQAVAQIEGSKKESAAASTRASDFSKRPAGKRLSLLDSPTHRSSDSRRGTKPSSGCSC